VPLDFSVMLFVCCDSQPFSSTLYLFTTLQNHPQKKRYKELPNPKITANKKSLRSNHLHHFTHARKIKGKLFNIM
jgi:hypothetical protein